MFFRKCNLLILLISILTNPLFGEGFIAGTLVKTLNSYIPIEQLTENDLVVTYDFKKNILVDSKITKTRKNKVNKIIQLTING